MTADGRPFFWLGDTAWELFHRLSREEAERYLANRARRRFTVIQAVVLVTVAGYIAVNLLVDIAYALLNPRVRLTGVASG